MILSLLMSPLPKGDAQSQVISFEAEISNPNGLKSSILEEEVTGRITYGYTTDGKTLARFKTRIYLSEDSEALIKEELKDYCDSAKMPRDGRPFPITYDEAKVDLDVAQDIPIHILNMTDYIIEALRKNPFPRIVSINLSQEITSVKQVKVKVKSLDYNSPAEMPEENSSFIDASIAEVFLSIAPLTALEPSCNENNQLILMRRGLPGWCFINMTTIQTFDLGSYNNTPLPCNSKAAMNYHVRNEFMVYFRRDPSSNRFYVTVMTRPSNDPVKVYFIEASFTYMAVNGMPIILRRKAYIFDTDGSILVSLYRFKGYILILLKYAMSIMVHKDFVRLFSYPTRRGQYEGMCGKYDGAREPEFVDTVGCIYRNETLYEYAFTDDEEERKGCIKAFLKQIAEEVTKYRLHCPRKLDSSELSCSFHAYPVLQDASLLCVSEEPIEMCASGCKAGREISVKIGLSE